MIIPISVLFYVYLAIFRAIKYAVEIRSVRGVIENTEENNNPEQKTNLDDLKQTLKFSKGLFGLYLMYLFTMLPVCLMMIIDINQELPSYYLIYPWIFFRFCSAVTPIIFPLTHSSIRFGYKNTIDRFVLRKKKEPEENEVIPMEQKKKLIKSRDYFTDL